MQYLSFCNWLISLSLASKFLLNDTIKRIQIKYAKICSWLWVVGINMVFKHSFYFSLFSNCVDGYFLSNTQVTHFFFFFNWSIIALRCCASFCCTVKVNHIYIYIHICTHISPSSWAPSQPPRSSQGSKLSSLCYAAASHQLSISHVVGYLCQCYFLNLSHLCFLPLCPHVHSLCVSIPALQIGSSVPFF